jgi:hypothetical protein
MTEDRTSALMAEKEIILTELKRHAKNDPRVQGILGATYEDMGTETDDEVHEMEAAEVDIALVDTLTKRLEDIEAELASLT